MAMVRQVVGICPHGFGYFVDDPEGAAHDRTSTILPPIEVVELDYCPNDSGHDD